MDGDIRTINTDSECVRRETVDVLTSSGVESEVRATVPQMLYLPSSIEPIVPPALKLCDIPPRLGWQDVTL